MFYQDSFYKKKVGSNIFRRVSTRAGGSNMSSMRVPTKKQMKEWSGKVMTYNLNEILNIDEFEQLNEHDQKMFLEHWRKEYKTGEIIEKMNINKNIFYRLLNKLNVEKAKRTRQPSHFNHSDSVNVVQTEISDCNEPIQSNGLEAHKEEILQHNTDISMKVDSETSFEFSIKGKVDGITLARRLELLINEVRYTNESLDITLIVKC